MFLFITLWYDHSLESPWKDDSNEWSQHRVWLRNKILAFAIYTWPVALMEILTLSMLGNLCVINCMWVSKHFGSQIKLNILLEKLPKNSREWSATIFKGDYSVQKYACMMFNYEYNVHFFTLICYAHMTYCYNVLIWMICCEFSRNTGPQIMGNDLSMNRTISVKVVAVLERFYRTVNSLPCQTRHAMNRYKT